MDACIFSKNTLRHRKQAHAPKKGSFQLIKTKITRALILLLWLDSVMIRDHNKSNCSCIFERRVKKMRRKTKMKLKMKVSNLAVGGEVVEFELC